MKSDKYSRYVLGALFGFIVFSRLIGYIKTYNRGVLIDNFLIASPIALLAIMSVLMFFTLKGNRTTAKILAVLLFLVVLSRFFSYTQFQFSDLNTFGIVMTMLDLVTVVYLYMVVIKR